MFYEHRPNVERNESFESTFNCPANEYITPESSDGVSDLEECCRLFAVSSQASFEPMERWLDNSPDEEAVYVDCMHMTSTTITRKTHQAASETPEVVRIYQDGTPSMIFTARHSVIEPTAPWHERSWLNLDDLDSEPGEVSLSGSGISTPRNVTPEPQPPDAAEVVRNVISTFGSLDRSLEDLNSALNEATILHEHDARARPRMHSESAFGDLTKL